MHSHDHPHPHDHNHGPAGATHLHSHQHGGSAGEHAEDLQVLAETFIDGFRQADDKTSFLRLAGVPFELPDSDGPSLKLVDVDIHTAWQVATASPGFGSPELVHMPFPGEMVRERTNMTFVYVSLRRRRDVDLRAFLTDRRAHDALFAGEGHHHD